MNEQRRLNDVVSELSERIDAITKSQSHGEKLVLIGGYTPFLNAIRKKAEKLGIQCVNATDADKAETTPVVVDTEICKTIFELSDQVDIDQIEHNGLSSCAQAIAEAFDYLHTLDGSNVTIIGRGHSVQGLADILVRWNNCTVTVCHSQTKNLYESTRYADVIVVAAPVKPAQVSSLAGKTIIDVSGTFKDFVGDEYYVGNIGRLTTSILLNRAVNVED
ncbi:MAG: hypothetical protein PUF41_11995 [Prevotella copri]|nr:hypothetical protein [Segatella copri]